VPGPESKPPDAASASVTAAGGRPDNQDRGGDGPTADGHAWIVADGLGGHAAGELAADCAVAAVLGALADRSALRPGEIERALDRLPLRYREVLLLVSSEGLTPAEAARACGITSDALRQRLSRGRAMLERELQSTTSAGAQSAREVLI
jgi:serine/threonine protein phosphatase PrpC